jgi:hypothetical protein
VGFDRNRPIISPSGSPRNRPAGEHLTDCKVCDEMIRSTESRIWATKVEPSKRMGLVHVPCVGPNVTTAGEPSTGGQHKYRT